MSELILELVRYSSGSDPGDVVEASLSGDSLFNSVSELVLELADPKDAGRTPKGLDFSEAIDIDPGRSVVVLMDSMSGVVALLPSM